MSHADFLNDTRALRERAEWWCVWTITAPNGSTITFRHSKRGTRNISAVISIGSDTIAAHERFDPRILQVPTISQSMWREGSILSNSLPSYGPAIFNNGDRYFDQFSPKEGYTWVGGTYKLYFFDRGHIQDTIGRVLEGKLGQPTFSLDASISVPIFGRERDYDRPLSTRVYRGTSYALELTGDKTCTFGVSPSAVNLRNNLTVKGWIYLEVVNTNLLVFYGLSGISPWRMVINASKQLTMFVTISGASQSRAMAKVLSARTFYHFACVISGRDVIFYLWDDTAQVLTIETYPLAFTVATRDTVGASVGFECKSSSDPTLKLWVDELQLFNYAQTKQEIADDRFRPLNTGIPSTCKHRVGFDEGTGTTANDSSASALHGTIAGAGTHTWLWVQEGGPELAGTAKPDTIGHKFGVRPVLVDPIRQGYQVACTSIQSIQAVEGGANFTMDASASTLRSYITTTPAAAHAGQYLLNGLFRLNATLATLPISAIVEGSNDSSSMGYVETVSEVARYMATSRGPKIADPSEIDTVSFTAFEAGFNPSIGVTYYESRQGLSFVKDGMDLALRSAGGWWGYLRGESKLHIEKYTGPSGSLTYTYNTRSGVADETIIVDLQPLDTVTVIYGVEVRYHYNDVVMSEDQVAASIKGTVSHTQWTRPYLTKRVVDEDLREKYEGKSGKILIVETAIYGDADAQTLAVTLLAELKGEKFGYRVTVNVQGLSAKLGQTEGLGLRYQNGMIVLGLDGNDRYVILGTIDNSNGTVTHEVLP